jgi:hypothetical protein
MQFGNIHGPLPYAQHIDNDQFRLCFGGHVGTVETLHTARKFAKYKKSNSVLFVYFNRTPAHEAKASLEWATTEYGTVFVQVLLIFLLSENTSYCSAQGSSLEPGPAAMHSSANVFHRSLRPPVPWPSTLSSDILTHIRPVERSVGQRPRTNTQRPKLDVFTVSALFGTRGLPRVLNASDIFFGWRRLGENRTYSIEPCPMRQRCSGSWSW